MNTKDIKDNNEVKKTSEHMKHTGAPVTFKEYTSAEAIGIHNDEEKYIR